MLADRDFVAAVAREATEIIARTPAHLGRWRLDLGGARVAGDSGAAAGGPSSRLTATTCGHHRGPSQCLGRHVDRIGRLLLAS
ncbi:hypothetical protein I553_10701 [Mycobacterium xenopi 4042]|uniref:Uncharacterized protein n=1 Tax=Mycobacterium xenopi 4042 TaxID=1299334 RepID=X8DAM5_MYCXE|nr:hypothetical protein I553_10701 [Mycobacterium xenopi 4042]